MQRNQEQLDKTTMSICLVLGANGFIGSHLVDKLQLQADLQVRAFDRYRRSAQFATGPNVAVIKGDVVSEDLDQALEGATYLIHALSASTPFAADVDPYADINNLLQTISIFERAIKKGVQKLVFISSGGAVYGRSAEQGVADETTQALPISPYGICKLSVEHYLEYFRRKYGTEYVVYRVSNPYGPRQVVKQNQGVIPAFLERIAQGKGVSVFGDGSISRDYIYIEDAVQMIAGTFRKANAHAVYNIGSGRQTTLNEIIVALQHILQKEITIAYGDVPKTFLSKTDISIKRFCEEFGKPDFTGFLEGLERTIKYNPDI